MQLNIGFPNFLAQMSIRIWRLFCHFLYPINKSLSNKFPPDSFFEWLMDTGFYLMDVIAIPEIYQIFMRLVKWNTRKLTQEEIQLSIMVFGQNIDCESIRIDSKAKFGTKKIALAYVSFNTINYQRKIRKAVFIHELVHIWQYQHFGSIYIARAIKAQRSKEGYDYGGAINLYNMMLKGARLIDFNFEQQADIIEDYYRLLTEKEHVGALYLGVYKYYAEQLEIGL
jgi:hypothetical protein